MYQIIKRSFDLISATILFIIISPLFATISLIVWSKMGRPVFFRQTRTTKSKRCFKILKFRTMLDVRDDKGELLADKYRMTALGTWLRSSSLDELPELINIIKGDMSVIGPRPLQPKYNDFYTDYELNRFKVRGGLIPPETLIDNHLPTWDEQLKVEADYANNISIKLDWKIFRRVFKLLFNRDTNNYGGYVRMNLEEERKDRKRC